MDYPRANRNRNLKKEKIRGSSSMARSLELMETEVWSRDFIADSMHIRGISLLIPRIPMPIKYSNSVPMQTWD